MTNLKNRLAAAKQRLENAGYELLLSSMNDGGTDEYGSLYVKGEMKVWVNNKTLPALEIK